MPGLTDDLVAGCVATVDCHRVEHRLVVRDHALVALDHQSESAKVLDALTDEVPCLQMAAAWEQSRSRFAHLGTDPFLRWIGELVPADLTPAEHEAYVQAQATTYVRFQTVVAARQRGLSPDNPQAVELDRMLHSARASERVLQLPDRMRLYFGVLCAAEAAASGDLEDAHAQELTSAVAACIASWADLGYPAASARVQLLDALRVPHRRNGVRTSRTTHLF